ncbi:MAG: CRISPR-associated endonuclease Cas2 [Anaerovoracaceae bacterium]
MSYRFMRVIVFFDLPMVTGLDRREYSRFRKFLIKSGFVMMQQSVYSKIALNTTAANALIGNVRKEKPLHGLVQMMVITEKQYNKIEVVVGDAINEVINSDERLLIL